MNDDVYISETSTAVPGPDRLATNGKTSDDTELTFKEEGGTAVPQTLLSGRSDHETQNLVPVMSRDELRKRLLAFERRYDMTSEEFYRRWQAGDAPRVVDAMRWILLYEFWRDRYLI